MIVVILIIQFNISSSKSKLSGVKELSGREFGKFGFQLGMRMFIYSVSVPVALVVYDLSAFCSVPMLAIPPFFTSLCNLATAGNFSSLSQCCLQLPF